MTPPKRLNLRVPKGLHDALEAQAKVNECSLNALALSLLAGSIGWNAANGAEPPAKPKRLDVQTRTPLDVDRLRAFRDAYDAEASSPKGRIKGWSVAKTKDHAYAVRERAAAIGAEAAFDEFCEAIRDHGRWQRYGKRSYAYLHLDGLRYWTLRERTEAPEAWTDPDTTWIINRSLPEADDDQQTIDLESRRLA